MTFRSHRPVPDPMRHKIAKFVLPALLMVAGVSCYRYVPVVQAPPGAGTDVRLFLTADGAQRLAPIVGVGVVALDGRILGDDGPDLRFSVARTRTASASRANWEGAPITLPRDAIARTELRAMDRPRTIRAVIATAAGAIGVGFVLKALVASGDPGGGGKGDPTPP